MESTWSRTQNGEAQAMLLSSLLPRPEIVTKCGTSASLSTSPCLHGRVPSLSSLDWKLGLGPVLWILAAVNWKYPDPLYGHPSRLEVPLVSSAHVSGSGCGSSKPENSSEFKYGLCFLLPYLGKQLCYSESWASTEQKQALHYHKGWAWGFQIYIFNSTTPQILCQFSFAKE